MGYAAAELAGRHGWDAVFEQLYERYAEGLNHVAGRTLATTLEV
jgi:hypothetical protein